jgi:anti-sigma B factor antagonist
MDIVLRRRRNARGLAAPGIFFVSPGLPTTAGGGVVSEWPAAPASVRRGAAGLEDFPMSLKINIRETPNASILDMSGRLTLGESLTELRDTIRDVISGARKNVVLNLAEVSYIDSSGLGQLVGSFATVTNNGGEMKLLNLQKKVQDLMQVTKLLTVFEAYSSEEAALRSFARAAAK